LVGAVPDLSEHFTTFVMVGIVIVIGTSRLVHRGAGAILGIVFWALTAIFGHFLYVQGGAVGFPGLPLQEPVFLAICGALLVLQVLQLRAWRQAQKRNRDYRDELSSIGEE
jgi:hypothetical protein